MASDFPTVRAQEVRVSCNTALSCLAQLRTQNSPPVDTESLGSRYRIEGDELPVSRLIDLAGEFGFGASYGHRDWDWLSVAVASHPVLLLLKNANVVVALRKGRRGV